MESACLNAACSQIPRAFLLVTMYNLSSSLSLLMLLFASAIVFPLSFLYLPKDVTPSLPYLLLFCVGDLMSCSHRNHFGYVLAQLCLPCVLGGRCLSGALLDSWGW